MAVTRDWIVPEDYGFQTVFTSQQADDISSRFNYMYDHMYEPYVLRPSGETRSSDAAPGTIFTGLPGFDVTLAAQTILMALTALVRSSNNMTDGDVYVTYRFTKGSITQDMLTARLPFDQNSYGMIAVGNFVLNAGVWTVQAYLRDTDLTSNDRVVIHRDSVMLLNFMHFTADRMQGSFPVVG